MSNDPSQTRKVVPYKANKRISTFRKLDIDFAGTAIEQALMMQQLQLDQDTKQQLNNPDLSPSMLASESINVETHNVAPSSFQTLSQDPALPAFTKIVPQSLLVEHDQTDLIPDLNSSKPDLPSKQKDQLHSLDTSIYQRLVSENTVSHQRPVPNRDQYLSETSTPLPATTAGSKYLEPDKNYFKVPNIVGDDLLSFLDPYEFKVFFRLLRLSHGFHQTQCFVGYKALSEACNLSIAQLKRVIPSLIKKGVIRVVQYFNSANKKGTVYEIITSIQPIPVSIVDPSLSDTSIYLSTNKEHDHDDLKKTDHHQNAHARETMTLYQKLTGNSWTKADDKSYAKIKHLPLDQIATTLRTVMSRATQKPASLAYFVKEILNPTQPNPANREALKKKYKAILTEIRELNVGGGGRLADIVPALKDRLVSKGIALDLDLINECLK